MLMMTLTDESRTVVFIRSVRAKLAGIRSTMIVSEYRILLILQFCSIWCIVEYSGRGNDKRTTTIYQASHQGIKELKWIYEYESWWKILNFISTNFCSWFPLILMTLHGYCHISPINSWYETKYSLFSKKTTWGRAVIGQGIRSLTLIGWTLNREYVWRSHELGQG